MITPVRVFLRGIIINFKTKMAYRLDFIFNLFIVLIFDTITPVIMIIIYSNGVSFPEWSLFEVILIQSIVMIAQGIFFPFIFGIVWNVLSRIREGTFDILLLMPRSSLLMTLVTGIDIDDLGGLVCGIVFFIIAIINLGVPILANWFLFIILFCLSLMVLTSIALFMAGSIFLWQGNDRILELYSSLISFTLYPATIYSRLVRNVITFIIPLLMIGFFPACILIGRKVDGLIISSIVSVVIFIIAIFFWKIMSRKYSSAGG